jgi:hypothetical protein
MKIKLKNTKLQDENKRPIIFYHATPCKEKIESFLPLSHFGTKTASQMRSMHFIYKALGLPEPAVLPKEMPKAFQRRKIPDITTYQVYLSMKSPLKMSDFGQHSLVQFYTWFSMGYKPKPVFLTGAERCEGDVVGPAKIKYKKHISDFIFVDPFTKSKKDLKKELLAERLYDTKYSRCAPKYIPSFLFPVHSQINRDYFSLAEKVAFQRMIRFLEGEGYDGFVYQNDHEDSGNNSYIIFRPQQVFDPVTSEEVHIVEPVNKGLLQKIENDFFESKGILSPIQRIQKYHQLKYCRYVKKQKI